MSDDLISRSWLLEQYELKDCTKYGNETAEQKKKSYDTMMMYEIAEMIKDAPTIYDMDKIKEALQEIQQYRAIGTIEEIKEILQIISEGQDDVDESGISTGLLHVLLEYAVYKKIGTVEECREARERQRGKRVKNRKLLRDFYNISYSVRGDCPNCGSIGLLSTNTDYCNACGQKLDWFE